MNPMTGSSDDKSEQQQFSFWEKSTMTPVFDRRTMLLAGAATILPIRSCPALAQADQKLTPDEARTLARDAWVFGMPLVYIEKQIDTLTYVTKPEGHFAPINQFAHYRELPDASNRTVVGLNVDTLYSFGQLDLSQGPIVLTIPDMGNRYWLMQFIDGWNNVPHAPGSRTVGGKGGNFAIVGPKWSGTLPAGLTELRVPTTLILIGGRTYTSGKDDYAAVHALQDQYKLTPLSEWGKAYTPPDNVPLKPGVDAKTPVTTQVLGMSPETFFGRLNTLMVDNPPEPADPATMARLARLGIAPGATFSMAAFSPEVRKAIEEGVAQGQKLMRETALGKEVNGWQIALDMGRYGTNYPYRAAWTFFGVGGNLPEDAIYPTTVKDREGKPLDGANNYELRFAKNEIPPVDAFWSLTMYDADSYLVPNSINRYALGDRSGMKFGDDGSLKITIQAESPSADRQANWLPAPKQGGMRLALRLYAPRKEVADGTWSPPPVMRV
jgi:hypothetical protein